MQPTYTFVDENGTTHTVQRRNGYVFLRSQLRGDNYGNNEVWMSAYQVEQIVHLLRKAADSAYEGDAEEDSCAKDDSCAIEGSKDAAPVSVRTEALKAALCWADKAPKPTGAQVIVQAAGFFEQYLIHGQENSK